MTTIDPAKITMFYLPGSSHLIHLKEDREARMEWLRNMAFALNKQMDAIDGSKLVHPYAVALAGSKLISVAMILTCNHCNELHDGMVALDHRFKMLDSDDSYIERRVNRAWSQIAEVYGYMLPDQRVHAI